jgi:5'-3' exoribonuclease 2
MNGLIHPSCNPQSDNNIRLPTNFNEQCENIFEYIDKLMKIVRPQRLLYLAIDGVAPRAKMNQQRSRRFRAARESLINEERKQRLREEFVKKGVYSQEIEDFVNRKSFDSNVITPGTQFLSNVSLALNYFIHDRMNNHPLWKGLVVVFSDANCPGEG